MKALTIHQPYAALIVAGQKTVENRPWRTSHRGMLLIHAGKSTSWMGYYRCQQKDGGADWPEPACEIIFGAIVGAVEVVGCVSDMDPRVRDNPWAFGPWCWLLKSPMIFDEPVFCPGRQRLWTVPRNVVTQVREQIVKHLTSADAP